MEPFFKSVRVPRFLQVICLKSEYHASDPLQVCVYILCLYSVVSHEHSLITIASHKNPAKFQQGTIGVVLESDSQ